MGFQHKISPVFVLASKDEAQCFVQGNTRRIEKLAIKIIHQRRNNQINFNLKSFCTNSALDGKLGVEVLQDRRLRTIKTLLLSPYHVEAIAKKKKQTNSCKLYIERSVFVETTKQMCSTIENKRSSMVYLVQTQKCQWERHKKIKYFDEWLLREINLQSSKYSHTDRH